MPNCSNPFTNFDESVLTGESVPFERQQGRKVVSGSLSVDQVMQMKMISKLGKMLLTAFCS
jgi:Cd2+/Zn2+-exporting ATPase